MLPDSHTLSLRPLGHIGSEILNILLIVLLILLLVLLLILLLVLLLVLNENIGFIISITLHIRMPSPNAIRYKNNLLF